MDARLSTASAVASLSTLRSPTGSPQVVVGLTAQALPPLACVTPPPSGDLVVDGGGPLAGEVAEQVRRSGLGQVVAGPLASATAESVARSDPPAAVVLVSGRAPSADRGAVWWDLQVPVLPVVGRGGMATVGPLALRGSGSCLRCHERTRADLCWSLVDLASSAPVVAALRPLVAAVTVTMLATALRDCADLVGISVDLVAGEPVLRHRYWPPHPGCACTSQASG